MPRTLVFLRNHDGLGDSLSGLSGAYWLARWWNATLELCWPEDFQGQFRLANTDAMRCTVYRNNLRQWRWRANAGVLLGGLGLKSNEAFMWTNVPNTYMFNFVLKLLSGSKETKWLRGLHHKEVIILIPSSDLIV